MGEIVIGLGALDRRLSAISNPAAMRGLLGRIALNAVREEKALAPKKTGNLRRTIHVGAVTTAHAELIASADYAAFVEYGTRPHEITPNARKALRWVTGSTRLTGTATKATQRAGGYAFAKRVHHPGTTGKHFMVEGAKTAIAKSPLADAVITAWNEAA